MRAIRAMVMAVVALLMLVANMPASFAQPGVPAPPASLATYDAAGNVIAVEASDLPQQAVPQLQPQAQLATVLMSEGFEGAWPAPSWTIADLSTTDGGEHLWGKRNCAPHTGAYAGWTIGGGSGGSTLGCGDSYPNNARVRALYGPFDLSAATSASLSYHIRGRTEGYLDCPFDYLGVAAGTSESGPFSGNAPLCGDLTGGSAGNGYSQYSLDLSSWLGQSQVWIAFFFVSDSSINDIGLTIDDISLIAETSTPPPLTGYDGEWSGTTSQGQPITLTIANNIVTSIEVAVVIGGCTITSTTDGDIPISDNGFAASLEDRGIAGAFSSATQASGTGFLTSSNPLCSGTANITWSATRAGAPLTYSISGTVRALDGVPVAGATVVATPSQSGQAAISGQSGANGSYTLSAPAGSYSVQATKAGYQVGASLSVSLPPNRTGADLTLTPDVVMYSISGKVRDSAGAPLVGASITATLAQLGQAPIHATSGADGSYTLTAPVGSYSVQATKAGYKPGVPLSVSLPPSRTGADLTLQLEDKPNEKSLVYLPVVLKIVPEPTPVTPTPVTPTPVTPTPVTPTPVTPTPEPTPISLPDPVTALALGTTTTEGSTCAVADPLPWPVQLPSGSKSFAFQLNLRVPNSSSISVSISPGFGAAVRGTSCNGYAVINGQLYQNRLGAQVERLDGLPLTPGDYKLMLRVNGSTTEVPFSIQ